MIRIKYKKVLDETKKIVYYNEASTKMYAHNSVKCFQNGIGTERGYLSMNKKMYVDVNEICEDWGVSRAQGYKMIKQLNKRMLALNPNLIVLSGKVNCRFYEENCYGMAKEA